jgi:hypothetical protein
MGSRQWERPSYAKACASAKASATRGRRAKQRSATRQAGALDYARSPGRPFDSAQGLQLTN